MSVVNDPEHYKVHEMECLLEMEAAFGREAVRNLLCVLPGNTDTEQVTKTM